MEFRVFGGAFWTRRLNAAAGPKPYTDVELYGYTIALNGMSGASDLFTEDYYFSRTNSHFGGNPRAENMGNFKVNGTFGTTHKMLFAGNYYLELPVKPKLFGIFADYGVFHNGIKAEQVFNTGLGVKLGPFCSFYFPVWMSQNMENSFGKNYFSKIRFSLKMNIVNQSIRISTLF